MQRFLKYAVFFLGVFTVTIPSPSSAKAATYIPLDDSVYSLILRLEAEGIIKSGLITTLPLSRREVVRVLREAEKAGNKNSFLEEVIDLLRRLLRDDIVETKFIKPVDNLYTRYFYADSGIQGLYYNNDGDKFRKGSNVRLGFSSKAELGRLSFYVNPEFRYSEADDSGDKDEYAFLKTGYGVLNFAGLDLQVGKDSQWWGPGYHGALMLSNNPDPLTVIKLSNSQPALLPWIFKYLGPFRFTLIETRLEKDKNTPEPYIWGMRLNFKPIPYLEAGIQRTAVFAGKGRLNDVSAILKSFGGSNEDELKGRSGVQRAGFDLKLTVPSWLQPFQLYLEAGEDGTKVLQSKWSYITGLYLPRILLLDRLGFRAEYSENYFVSSFISNNRAIGHHMGVDSSDMFFELNYHVPELNGRINVSYDIEKYSLSVDKLSGTANPTKIEASVGLTFNLTNALNIEGKYTFGKFKNPIYVNDSAGNINLFALSVEYYF